jgi:Domain of unknown function (DUF4111)
MPSTEDVGAAYDARLAEIPFNELRTVLVALRDSVRSVLGENLAAFYLQGSFAQGDGDVYSDVDFVAVTHDDVDNAVESALNAMHGRLHDRPETWAQHLEGSYAPVAVIRRPPGAADAPRFARPDGWRDPAIGGGPPARGYPFLFLGNGSRTLVRSEHDNTNVVRWVLREHGIALHGPPAAEVIDPVEPGALAAEVRQAAASFANTLLSGETILEALHLQGFTVLFYCRVLQSLATGRIPSKPEAMRWALVELGPRWAPLIEDAWRRRSEYPRGRGAPALHAALHPSDAAVAESLAFVRFALDWMGPAATGA